MTNYKEILRLKSLGLTHVDIASACSCGRNTVTRTLSRAREQGITWDSAQAMTPEELRKKLFPEEASKPQYKMPDYEKVHRELQRPGVTLSLLWVEYCEECRSAGELEHRPGETMQVDWVGQTAFILDTDTGELVPAYLFIAVLPYSGYAYTEAFLDMKQEA